MLLGGFVSSSPVWPSADFAARTFKQVWKKHWKNFVKTLSPTETSAIRFQAARTGSVLQGWKLRNSFLQFWKTCKVIDLYNIYIHELYVFFEVHFPHPTLSVRSHTLSRHVLFEQLKLRYVHIYDELCSLDEGVFSRLTWWQCHFLEPRLWGYHRATRPFNRQVNDLSWSLEMEKTWEHTNSQLLHRSHEDFSSCWRRCL